MRNDKFGAHLTSGNGAGCQDVVHRHPEKQQERARNLKFAIFYLAVGVALFVANQFAKQPQRNGNQRSAVFNIGLDLSVGRRPEPTATGSAPTKGATYAIPFRLTNRGNQSVFYPVYPGTNRPIGRLVYRVAPGSEWVVLPWPNEPTSTLAPPNVEDKVDWVEMPPGGWVDGIYDDPGSPGGDHAYAVDLKVAINDNVVHFVSHAYRVSAN
jgi:hypothetical protein